MNLNHINVIARYEVKLVKRSWLFRIFAILALLFISAIMLGYQTGIVNRMDNLWPRIAVSSLMPFCNTYFYNIAQSVIVVFLAGSFLKRDKKLDTAEVIYVRPMSNADYIVGKTWGIVKVFITLNIITLLFTAFLISVRSVSISILFIDDFGTFPVVCPGFILYGHVHP